MRSCICTWFVYIVVVRLRFLLSAQMDMNQRFPSWGKRCFGVKKSNVWDIDVTRGVLNAKSIFYLILSALLDRVHQEIWMNKSWKKCAIPICFVAYLRNSLSRCTLAHSNYLEPWLFTSIHKYSCFFVAPPMLVNYLNLKCSFKEEKIRKFITNYSKRWQFFFVLSLFFQMLAHVSNCKVCTKNESHYLHVW